MKRIIIIFIAVAFCVELNAQDLKVLFVGNSYTYVNDLPNILKQIAQSNGKNITTKSFTYGGARLMSHWGNEELQETIKNGKYDIIILQGQSQEMAFPPEQFNKEVYPYAKKLDSLYKENNPNGRVIYFMTWGYRYGDKVNCPFYPPYCTYETMSQELCQNYCKVASDFNSEVSPIGSAWLYLFNQDSISFDLHSSDYSHPNIKGSYFSACVLYTTIFKTGIVTSYTAQLNQEVATALQQTANFLFSNNTFNNCSFTSLLPNLPKNDIDVHYIATQRLLEVINYSNQKNIILEIYNLNGIKIKQFVVENEGWSLFDVKMICDGYYITKIRTKKSVCTYNFIKQ